METGHEPAPKPEPQSPPQPVPRTHGEGGNGGNDSHPGQHLEHGVHREDGMVELARRIERAHLAPAPDAAPPSPAPFPAGLAWGLGLGVAVGALAGWAFGELLLRGALVVPRWEQLYSMGPAAFITLWVGVGVAFGGAVGGGATILLVSIPPDPDRQSEPPATHRG